MIFSRGKDAILSMDLTSSSKIFVKKEFVSDKAENHWPRRFKEDYISFIFQNVYSSKDLIYQTHWICCEKLNMIQIISSFFPTFHDTTISGLFFVLFWFYTSLATPLQVYQAHPPVLAINIEVSRAFVPELLLFHCKFSSHGITYA